MLHIVHDKDWLVTTLLQRECLRYRNRIEFDGHIDAIEDVGCWPPETAVRRCRKLVHPFLCRDSCGDRVRIVGIYFMLPGKHSSKKWLGNVFFAYTVRRQKKVRLTAWANFPFEALVNFFEEQVWYD